MPTTLEEAIRILDPLPAEHAALKPQLAARTEHMAQTQQAQAKTRPNVKATVPNREPKRRCKRAPQHNRGRKYQTMIDIPQAFLNRMQQC